MSSQFNDITWYAEHRGQSERPKVQREIATAARHAYRLGHKRREIFGDPSLFEDPAWDIMLSLIIDEAAGRDTSVSAACISARVAPTTALRWIAKLVATGVLVREEDPFDRRRSWLRLTSEAKARVEYLLTEK